MTDKQKLEAVSKLNEGMAKAVREFESNTGMVFSKSQIARIQSRNVEIRTLIFKESESFITNHTV